MGKEHLRRGKNNQDAFYWRQTDDLTIAVVADGCGSGKFSEVGAQIGVRIFINSFVDTMNHWSHLPPFLGTTSIPLSKINLAAEYAKRLLLQDLKSLAEQMSYNPETVREYFLFTLVGAVITPEYSALFHIGDGVICKNGVITKLGPYPSNQPPYLAYDLLDQSLTGFSSKSLMFNVPFVTQTSDIQSILIGTDGVTDLSRAFPLNQFWENDLYFKNPDAVRRRLSIINRPAMKIDWEKQEVEKKEGHLPDDTTLIVIRRR